MNEHSLFFEPKEFYPKICLIVASAEAETSYRWGRSEWGGVRMEEIFLFRLIIFSVAALVFNGRVRGGAASNRRGQKSARKRYSNEFLKCEDNPWLE